MTTIHFRCNGEHAQVNCDETTTSLLDVIEETLYVLWELEPAGRDWKWEWVRFHSALFAYSFEPPQRVTSRLLNTDGSEVEILVEDVPLS